MSSTSSPLLPLSLAIVTAGVVAFGLNQLSTSVRIAEPKAVSGTAQASRWSATAAGRVEPKGGEIKLAALTAGRIDSVLVKVGDKVKAGDLLVRIEDVDAMARLLGADAEAGVRKRERDTETNVPKLTQDRRNAEDRLNNTERAITLTRMELDRLLAARHADPASVTAEQIENQRKALAEATLRLEPDRQAHRQSQLAQGVPLPTRLEAGLTASRAELTLAEAALERTRVRAPFDATVLQVHARLGELAAASPEQPLVVIGDLSGLEVRAEVEERDVAHVTAGQEVVLRTDAYPGREMTGRVRRIGQSMHPQRLAQKGPRRPSDIDTLEVMIDVEGETALVPGMRVDVFFKQRPVADAAGKTTGTAAAAQTEGAMRPSAAKVANPVAPATPAASGEAPKVLPPLPEAAKKDGN
jgi:HlyD family secretion protein